MLKLLGVVSADFVENIGPVKVCFVMLLVQKYTTKLDTSIIMPLVIWLSFIYDFIA